MQINFLGGGETRPEPDTDVTHIDVWFDRDQTRVWWVTSYNAAGDQVGDSSHHAHKADAVRYAKDLREDQYEECSLSIGKRDGSY